MHMYNDNCGVASHCAGETKLKTFLSSEQYLEYVQVRALAKKIAKDEVKVVFHEGGRKQNMTADQIAKWGREKHKSLDEVVPCMDEEAVKQIIITVRNDGHR